MTEAHIYIYGVISAQDSKSTNKFGRVGLKEVVEQMHMAKDAELLKVHIRSEGGDVDEGFAIHDALVRSGKTIETIGEGMVASIATVIYLAGSKRIMQAGSEFIIHNPWTKSEGTADELQRNADGLREIENILANFYTQKTGINLDLIRELMAKETTLTSEQSKNYGFATEVIQTLQAVALYNSNKNNLKMTKEEIGLEMDKKFEGFFSKIKNLFSKAKNLVVTTGDGSMLDFAEQIQDVSEIAVGMTAKLEDGSSPEGDYVMPDGTVLTFVAGAITAIVPVGDEGGEMEALKAENETLKQQLADAQAQALAIKTDSEAKFNTLQKEIVTFKAQIKTDVESFSKSVDDKDDKPVNRFEKVFVKN